jgi:hypothetical protein|tara:strand:- start:73 stop:420 length:348 start_codon:yes stop_codon:yes gene_type:complete
MRIHTIHNAATTVAASSSTDTAVLNPELTEFRTGIVQVFVDISDDLDAGDNLSIAIKGSLDGAMEYVTLHTFAEGGSADVNDAAVVTIFPHMKATITNSAGTEATNVDVKILLGE